MKKLIVILSLAALSLTMLLPVARQVNAASVNQSVFAQGGSPNPPGQGSGGGHFAQGGSPNPPGQGSGGGH